MDFAFTEAQTAVADLSRKIFAERVTPTSLKAAEADPDWIDRRLWIDVANAGLLATAIPEAEGGSGHGMQELCALLVEAGASVAPIPLWPVLLLGALPIAAHGSSAQKQRWLPGVASGETLLTAALAEENALDPTRPETTAARVGGRWSLDGVKICVPAAHLAARVLVPAAADGGVMVALVDPTGPGATLERAVTTDRQVHPHLELDGVVVEEPDVLGGSVAAGGDAGAGIVAWMLDRARTGLCALQLGVTEEAVRRTAAYLNERHQFGRPLSSFQATMLRAADAYIDTEAIRVTTWQAAWRIDSGLPAAEAVAVAHWWASDAGQRVVHATQHLHGGMGADIAYPIHRYFLWGKQIELMLQGPSAELARLGTMVATRLHQGVAGDSAVADADAAVRS